MNCVDSVINYYFTISLLQSTHKLLHRQVRGDDPLNSSHRRQLQYEAGGSLNPEGHAVRHKVCRKTHSRDSPSDTHGKQPSNNLRQKACYEQRVASSLSEALSEPILLEKLVHRQYLHGRDHAAENSNSHNSFVQVE